MALDDPRFAVAGRRKLRERERGSGQGNGAYTQRGGMRLGGWTDGPEDGKMGLDAGGRTEGIRYESLRKRIQGRGGGTHNSSLSQTQTTTVRVMAKRPALIALTKLQ